MFEALTKYLCSLRHCDWYTPSCRPVGRICLLKFNPQIVLFSILRGQQLVRKIAVKFSFGSAEQILFKNNWRLAYFWHFVTAWLHGNRHESLAARKLLRGFDWTHHPSRGVDCSTPLANFMCWNFLLRVHCRNVHSMTSLMCVLLV